MVQEIPTATHCIRFARFTADADAPLTKRFALGDGSELIKTTAAQLTSGRVEVLTVGNFDDFAAVLTTLNASQALSYGIPKRGAGVVMSEGKWEKIGRPADVILRNRLHFEWSAGGGVWMLDYDPPPNGPVLQRDELLAQLYETMPQLADAPHLWWPSTSSHISNSASGADITGLRGQRVYVQVTDAQQIEKLGAALTARLWLIGGGRYEVSKSGQRLARTLVDAAVWQPERLDFAAGALCMPPIQQRRGEPLRLGGSVPLDPASIKPLTETELERVARLQDAAKDAVADEVSRIKAVYVSTRANELQARGIGEERAKRAVESALDGQLLGDFELIADTGERVTVSEMLNNKSAWHGRRFADPVEPDYNSDGRIAWANLLSGGRPYVWSHAHGGVRYALVRAQRVVQITDGGTGTAVEETLQAMRGGDFYECGDSVVVIDDKGDMRTLGVYALKQEIERTVSYQRYDSRKRGWRAVDCPDEVAKRIREMKGNRNLREIVRVIHHPIMTSEGRAIDEPGHDPQTRLLLLNPEGMRWPKIPSAPSKGECLAALAALWEPFKMFPFKDSVSRGVMLAALFTACIRPALSMSPAFMIAAPAAGTGKSLLASSVVELAGGATPTTLPADGAEIHKTLVAALRAAPAAIFFDNVTGSVGGEALNAIITSDTYSGRVLGVSEITSALSTRVFIVMTGNNATPRGDMCRRMLTITIDAEMETPYRRTFSFNPLEMVTRNHQELRRAALTILAGRFATGRKSFTDVPPLGGFEQWDHAVRQTVLWIGEVEQRECGSNSLGFGDPIGGVQAQYAEDEETASTGDVLETWAAAQDGNGFTSAALFSVMDRIRRGSTGAAGIDVLGQSLNAAAPWVKSARSLGRWFQSMRGRIVRGLRLTAELDRATNAQVWRVQRVAP